MIPSSTNRWLRLGAWIAVLAAALSFFLWIACFEDIIAICGVSNWLTSAGLLALLAGYLMDIQLYPGTKIQKARRYAIYFGILLGSLAWAFLDFRISAIGFFPDTWEYISVAGQPIPSSEFFTAVRAPTLPLFLKLFNLLGFTSPSHDFLARAVLFTQFQWVLYWTSIVSLGFVILSLLKQNWIKPIGLALVLIFGLSTHLSMWNKIVYAESLSISFFFYFLAALFLLEYQRGEGKEFGRGHVALLMSAMVVAALLYALARDTDAYLLLGFGTVFGLLVVGERVHKRTWNIRRLFLATILVGIFGLSFYSSTEGHRWIVPNLNIIHERILPNQASLEFYVNRGMPYEGYQDYFSRDRKAFESAVISDDEAEPIYDWLLQDGLRTYESYLMANPLRTLYRPLRDIKHLLFPDSREYQQLSGSPPGWISLVDSIVYPNSVPILVVWFVGVVLGLAYHQRKSGWDWRFLIPALMVLISLPLMFLIYYGDDLEIERHALGLAMQIRLSLLLLSLFLLDTIKVILPTIKRKF